MKKLLFFFCSKRFELNFSETLFILWTKTYDETLHQHLTYLCLFDCITLVLDANCGIVVMYLSTYS